jgi:hypothetical protein
MTQYAKDFSDELTTGVFASDFTSRGTTSTGWTIEAPTDAEDDRTFQYDGTNSGLIVITWDDIDGDANRDNVEVLMRFRATADNSNAPVLVARYTGSAGSEDMYVGPASRTSTMSFYRYDAGSFNGIYDGGGQDDIASPFWIYGSDQSPSFTRIPPNVWIYNRLRVNGTGATVNIKGKYWVDGINGLQEPPYWQMDYDDTDANRKTGVGGVGFACTVHSGTTDIDYFSVGTNGDAAPLNVSTNTTVRLSNLWIEVVGSNDNPRTRVMQANAEVIGANDNPTLRVYNSNVQVLHQKGTAGPADDVSGQLILTT